MALCRACCSHRATCSTSPAAGEVSVGAGEGDTLGIAPRKCSTAIQDPFQCLASPESNWAVLTESSAGCGVPIGACSFSVTFPPSTLMERHIAVIPLPGSLLFLVSSVNLTSRHVQVASSLTSCCWQRPPGSNLWAELGGPMPRTCWAGSHSCVIAGTDVGSQRHRSWEHNCARAYRPTEPGHQGCRGWAGENTGLQLGRATPSSLVLIAGFGIS